MGYQEKSLRSIDFKSLLLICILCSIYVMFVQLSIIKYVTASQ